MKDFTEKYRIRIKIFIYFLLFMVIPYIVLILVVNRTIQDYAGLNAGGNMEETMQSIGNQVKASLEMYENSTMALYYSGCVDMLESGETDRQYIESTLAACSYPYKNIRAVFLKSGGEVYHDNANAYSTMPAIMELNEEMIAEQGGKSIWFAVESIYGKRGTRNYVLARTLNGRQQKDVGTLYYVLGESLISRAFDRLQMEGSLKYMIDSEGTTLYTPAEVPLDEDVKEALLDTRAYRGYFIAGEDVVAYSRMEDTGWIFVGSVSKEALMESVIPLKIVLFVVSIAYCLLLLLIFYTFQHSLLKPISDLKYAMDRFARGDMETKMAPFGGELRSLSRHFNEMTGQIKELMDSNEKAIAEKNNFQIQALTAQLQPHFLYNALNTIKWTAVINKQENIQKLTEALVYILMNAVKGKGEDYTLEDELELIEQYAVIQKARFLNFVIEYEIQPETRDLKIFRFLLQPVVENSILHGFQRGMVQSGKIVIRAWLEEERLYVTVTDNGCGFDLEKWEKQKETGENHTNIGLRNIRQVIELEYGREYGMDMKSAYGDGTTVTYCLPVRKGRAGTDDDTSSDC